MPRDYFGDLSPASPGSPVEQGTGDPSHEARNEGKSGEPSHPSHTSHENRGGEPNNPETPCPIHQAEIQAAAVAERHGFTTSELAEACGEEWEWLRVRPEVLEPVAAALAASRAIDRGEIPEGWTETLACPYCGPVPIWPGGGAITDALSCPWCRRRAQGLPVPAPTQPPEPNPNGQNSGPQARPSGQGDA